MATQNEDQDTVLQIPRYCFEGASVYDNETQSDILDIGGFNASHISLIADALEDAARKLRKLAHGTR